jgi:hypothetical protein
MCEVAGSLLQRARKMPARRSFQPHCNAPQPPRAPTLRLARRRAPLCPKISCRYGAERERRTAARSRTGRCRHTSIWAEIGVASDDDLVASDDDLVASDDDLVASDDDLVASDDDLVASDDVVVASDDAPVASDDDVVASDDTLVASDDALVASDDTLVASDDAPVA